ncbi:unnamed protein product [Protopolystoma xenopodis]|uniref:Uncharacterized protein n=1 Tax=Protopolystoma xenopodis TaxID=117903 RepID=A0A3S4ZUG4_9PLAT|nr:unnamed protein product [Protopolystoma xenopodis]
MFQQYPKRKSNHDSAASDLYTLPRAPLGHRADVDPHYILAIMPNFSDGFDYPSPYFRDSRATKVVFFS